MKRDPINTSHPFARARLLLSILLCAPALCACPHDEASELPPGELPEEEIQASADSTAPSAVRDELERERLDSEQPEDERVGGATEIAARR